MPLTKSISSLTLFASLLSLPVAGHVLAQEPARLAPDFKQLRELKTVYECKRLDLDRREIADLTALAAKTGGAQSNAAYRELFSLAIARELMTEAREAADLYLASTSTDDEVRALATLVQVVAKGENGQDKEAIARLMALFKNKQSTGPAHPGPSTDMGLAVAETYLQRLIRLGRSDAARKLCETLCDEDAAPDAAKEHFEARMAPLELLGKAAPIIEGVDVEGKKVSLANMKGKVVLLDFWATWCPPCVEAIPGLKRLAATYDERDFAILGVNVDAMHENVKEPTTALPAVRRFLAHHDVTWMNILDLQGPGSFTQLYGVKDIPATFLIDRNGTMVAVELRNEALEKRVALAIHRREEAPQSNTPAR
jgi:thiol-disulfide isomerase/thioredoxin